MPFCSACCIVAGSFCARVTRRDGAPSLRRAVADTTAFTAGQAPGFLRCGGATQQHKINEVYVGGEDTASTPTAMGLARSSTISVGALSVGTLALRDALSTAPATAPSFGSTAATTFPQRSSTLYLLNLSLNTYGGIARWQARYGEEITAYGNTASLGEVIVSSKAGTGKSSGHILFEAV
jgi:hypothetical protein